ncbi:MAG TPA: pseudouridine synthase, partial [Myxococcota bacterium]|nr:pseudouridine synthase [Myxococcota bacterium]
MKPLYLDDELIVIAKPSGVSVHRGWAADGPFATDLVREALGVRTVHPVHRLDRPTSGVLVFARTPEAARVLSERWPEVDKTYLALTRGVPPE